MLSALHHKNTQHSKDIHGPGAPFSVGRPVRVDPKELLYLREWALAELGTHQGAQPTLWERASRCAPESWNTFLQIERCAAILRDRIKEAGEKGKPSERFATLTPAIRAVLETRANEELQRALSARAQMRRIARLVTPHGWRAVILKGGVAIESGLALYTMDVDVLLEPSAAATLIEKLDAEGDVVLHDGVATHHFLPRFNAHTVQIEVHHTLPYETASVPAFITRAIPLGRSGLFQMAPADHLWYILVHAIVQHPDRRGRIRELLLLEHALHACSPNDLASVESQIDTHKHRDALRQMLHMAQAVQHRVHAHDPLQRTILKKYVFSCRYLGRANGIHRRTITFICRDGSWLQEYRRDLSRPLDTPSSLKILNVGHTRAPRTVKKIRQLIRIARVTLVAALAVRNQGETLLTSLHATDRGNA